VTDSAIEGARRARVKVDFTRFEAYVHVSATLMLKLDNVYISHFRGDGALSLLDCFAATEDVEHREAFSAYISELIRVVEEVQECDGFDSTIDPQAYGVTQAVLRGDHILRPFDGRMSLPIATVSMLEDLKACILMEGRVIQEV
jgi:hypothetical protein